MITLLDVLGLPDGTAETSKLSTFFRTLNARYFSASDFWVNDHIIRAATEQRAKPYPCFSLRVLIWCTGFSAQG